MHRFVACWKVASSKATIPNKETAKESLQAFPGAITLSAKARLVRENRRTRHRRRTTKVCSTGVPKLPKHRTSDLEQEEKPGVFPTNVSGNSPLARDHVRCSFPSVSQRVYGIDSRRWHLLGRLEHAIHVVQHVHGPLSELRDFVSSWPRSACLVSSCSFLASSSFVPSSVLHLHATHCDRGRS